MGKLIIEGGNPLTGELKIHGAKNAALPILAGSLLAEGVYQIYEIPHLLDVNVMVEILENLGVSAHFESNTITLDTRYVHSTKVSPDLMGKMRSSIFLMGPLLARFKEVAVSKPGGCAIGERKIDLHLKGLEALGATIQEDDKWIICKAQELKGTTILLDYPSVGATENIMMAATKAKGTTKIINAAKEPEIVDLQNFLKKMGAKISGAGTNVIKIIGVDHLTPTSYEVIPDRIVAGTLMVAVGLTGGNVKLTNVIPEHLSIAIEYLKRIGVEIRIDNDIIIVERNANKLKAVDKIYTDPYPGFPTDLQAQFMSLLSIANGISIIEEQVFNSRYKHVENLIRMGADIRIKDRKAYIYGTDYLIGNEVEATDLRAGAALVIAGLAAKGKTIVENVEHIDRGYENIENVLQSIGAKITREK